MFSQYAERQPTSGWDRFTSLGHSSKFQMVSGLGFVTALTSLNGGQRNFARCLTVSWAGTLHIDFRVLLSPNRILPRAKFTFHPSLAFCCIFSITARHSSSGRQPNFAAFIRGRHLYSAGRPSCWVSALILVFTPCLKNVTPSTFYNLDIQDPIMTIFGRNVTGKVMNHMMLCFPTSPV